MHRALSWTAISIILILVAISVLAGCAGGPKPSLDQITPVCKALIGPIKYNSTVATSQRFAGPALAPDLKARNQVGQWLGCPAYKY